MKSFNKHVLNVNNTLDPENNFTNDSNMNTVFKFSFEQYILKWQRKIYSKISFSMIHAYVGYGIYKYIIDKMIWWKQWDF